MKTPEQIARETFAMMHSQAAEECENEILGHIVEGIKADRAQHEKEYTCFKNSGELD